MYIVIPAVVFACWAGSKFFSWFRAWLDARAVRRKAEERENDRINEHLREMFAAPATPPSDVVDGPQDRSNFEVHGMTVPELIETRAEFDEITGPEWPKQT